MYVYIVEELSDYEYGCRRVESVWMTEEGAQEHIKKKQAQIKLWTGETLDKYIINEQVVN